MTYGAAPFGTTPFGAQAGSRQVYFASGFSSTTFGTPNVVPGFVPSLGSLTTFGAPLGKQVWKATSLGVVTRFSPAYALVTQVLDASGFTATAFGTPVANRRAAVVIGRSVQPAGFLVTRFGTPAAAWTQESNVTGFSSTAFGTPASYVQGTAAGFTESAFGTPTAAAGQRATGFASSVFGSPVAALALQAASAAPRTRFGTPSTRTSAHVVYGFTRAGRFGQPSATARINRTASGFVGTQFGQPTSLEIHRAAHMPPATTFGTALLIRSTTC